MTISLNEIFKKRFLESKSQLFMVDDDKEYSYSDLAKMVGGVESFFKSINLRNPSVIAFRFKNSIQYAAMYIAIIASGNIAQPIYVEYSDQDIENVLNQSQADIFIDAIQNTTLNIRAKKFVYTEISQYFLKQDTDPFFVDYDCNRAVLYLTSSGTTGNPKVVAHSSKTLISNIRMHIESLNLNSNSVGMAILPLPFGYSNMTQFLVHFYLGGSIVVGSNLTFPPIFLSTVKKYKVTDVTVVPYFVATLLFFLENKGYSLKAFDTLRYFLFGGGTVPKTDFNKLKQLSGENLDFVQTYGCTECGPRITTKIINNDYDPSNLGRPLSLVDIRIINPDAAGNGLISVASPSIMLGYVKGGKIQYSDSQRFIPGDIGRMTMGGELIFKTRQKNMLKYHGFNLQVEDVENKVKESLAGNYGQVDLRVSQKEDETLVLEIEKSQNCMSESEILKRMKSIPAFMRPTEVKFVDMISRTATGKIKR